jgi:hypothetical protein
MPSAVSIVAWLALSGPPTTDVAPPPADPDTVRLADAITLRAGATCLERERLVAQVGTWIERERIDARLVVEVVGDANDPRKLAFTLRRGDDVIAVRRFHPAPSKCADVHSVVGLAIALAIDATLMDSLQRDPPEVVPEPDPEPKPEPEPEPEPAPTPKPIPTTPRPPKPKPREWTLWSEITGVFSIGAPPGVGGGARFGLYARWREIVDLGAGMVAQSSGSERVGEGSALMSAAAGRIDVCAGPRVARVRIRGCTGGIAGAALAAGQGFDDDTTIRVPWVAIPVGVRLEGRIADRFSLLFGAEGQGTVVRPTFDARSLVGERASRSFARFSLALEVGLAIHLW